MFKTLKNKSVTIEISKTDIRIKCRTCKKWLPIKHFRRTGPYNKLVYYATCVECFKKIKRHANESYHEAKLLSSQERELSIPKWHIKGKRF